MEQETEGRKEPNFVRHERNVIHPWESENWDEGERRMKGESGSHSVGEHKRDCRIAGWERLSLSLIWQAFDFAFHGDSGCLGHLHSVSRARLVDWASPFLLSNLGANIKMAYALALGMQGPDGARARSIPKLTLSLT